MEVLTYTKYLSKLEDTVLTIGTFDGVHLGHQVILKKIVEEARRANQKSVLITLWPHPRLVIGKQKDTIKLLSTLEEKVELVSQLGVDYLVKIPFTEEFSKISASDFLKEILIGQLGMKMIYIGYDHHFGNNREGDIQFLKKYESLYQYKVHEISRQDVDEVGVSSTRIREAISLGEIHIANKLLGYKYSLSGKVVEGMKVGRKIGYPTANIQVDEKYKLLPQDGVYVVEVMYEMRKYNGMLNIGMKPTVGGTQQSIEVHLFGFSEDIYGKKLTVSFIERLRKEERFNSFEDLAQQLKKDEKKAIQILESID